MGNDDTVAHDPSGLRATSQRSWGGICYRAALATFVSHQLS